MTPVAAVDLDLATLRCAQDGRVLTVRVEAPPFGYLTAAMQDDLAALVEAVRRDAGVGAVVVTGGTPGRYLTHFSIPEVLAGAESLPPSVPRPVASLVVRTVTALAAVGPARRLLARTPLSSLVRTARFQAACAAILRSPAVWIAAIDGPCGGGGLELSGFFDLRLATPDARVMLPELTVGLTTTFGGQRLATLLGPTRALALMLDADALTAAQAHALGWVDHVVDGDVVARAQALGARYARRPRAVVAAQKAIFTDDVPPAESLTREAVAQVVGLSSPTTRAALACWLDRQDRSGDSTFLTDPQPFRDGTALDLNPTRAARGRAGPRRRARPAGTRRGRAARGCSPAAGG